MNTVRSVVGALVLALATLSAVVAPAALAATSTITYYHSDITGSTVAATNAAKQVVWRESYRPYGERLQLEPASVANDIWFTSRKEDPRTELVYMGARWYDSRIGRFMATDPLRFDEANVHSFNRYAYGNNSPYKYRDPDGKAAETLWDLGSFALSVAIFKSDPTLLNFLAAAADGAAVAIPFVPGGIGAIRAAGKLDEAADEAAKLTKSLASESQLGEAGKAIAGPGAKDVFRDAERVASEHGGNAADWAKKVSSSYSARDGAKLETHWVENVATGQRVEHKTVISK